MHARAHAAKLTLCVQGVMDTGPEPELEALATIARRVFKADLACINFVSKRPCPAASHAAAAFNRSLTTCDTAPQVDADRQWTKASSSSGHLGLPPEIDRAISFDAHTILSDEVPPCTEALPRPAPPSVTPPLRPSATPPCAASQRLTRGGTRSLSWCWTRARTRASCTPSSLGGRTSTSTRAPPSA